MLACITPSRRWGAVIALSAVLVIGASSSLMAQESKSEANDNPLPAPPTTQELTAPNNANQQSLGDATSDDFAVLEDGPVHEAFVEPLSSNLETGILVKQKPPEPIEEVPPEYRPEGENVEWIPGYWMWSEDKQDFVWVSGLWRAVPPGKVWTPGYWLEEADGYRWISGFWSDVRRQQVEYLPYPPESLERGPSSPPPRGDYFWSPGCWIWREHGYAWRPGHWYPGQRDWIWTPPHYVYTPHGAVFVDGYWDYPVPSRGLLGAPVYWHGRYQAGYTYSPVRFVNTALLLGSLFIEPDHGHYYYGPSYRGRDGFYPWYARQHVGHYSPIYSYYSWQFGHDSNSWRGHFDIERMAARARGHRSQGPPKLTATIDEFQSTIKQNNSLGRRVRGTEYRSVTQADYSNALKRAKHMERFRAARAEFEASGHGGANSVGTTRPPGLSGPPGHAGSSNQARGRRRTLDLLDVEGARQLHRQAISRNAQRFQQQARHRGDSVRGFESDRPANNHLRPRDDNQRTGHIRPDRNLVPPQMHGHDRWPLGPPRGHVQRGETRPDKGMHPPSAERRVQRSRGNQGRSHASPARGRPAQASHRGSAGNRGKAGGHQTNRGNRGGRGNGQRGKGRGGKRK